MAEFVTVMKELMRMRNAGVVTSLCTYAAMERKPEEAEKIIMKWASEHPPKTLRDRFFELFPNAPKNADGSPKCCPSSLGWKEGCDLNEWNGECDMCWLTPWGEDNG